MKTGGTQPLYLQLRDGIRHLITSGRLLAGTRIPSSRQLATHFGIHRKTVVAALDELVAEGWLQTRSRSGTVVNAELPEMQPSAYGKILQKYPAEAGFTFPINPYLLRQRRDERITGFDDGFPDGRLAPLRALGKAYTQSLEESARNKTLSRFTRLEGSQLLRSEIARLMSANRGLPVSDANVLVTKGSQMSLYLVTLCLVQKGDNVVVTRPNFSTANFTFQSAGAKLLEVGVDAQGMCVDEVEALCKKHRIRCVFVTSHHHHPTTVSMAVERRIRLLQLAQQYNFAIIEDDYDYDYHYANKPLLPIAAHDRTGHVIYIGSFSKIISHVFRIGYVIAPANLVNELTMLRKIVDRQGDPILEKSIGKLLADNTIKNHVRKALLVYRERRDHAHTLLKSETGNYLQCQLPEGGLAFWSVFDRKVSLQRLSAACEAKGLYLSDGSFHLSPQSGINGCRMGFASMNTQEMEQAVDVLRSSLKK